MTESRKQFEDFLEKRNAALKAEGASSKFMVTNAHWATWQASRAELVVKLPDAEGWTDAGAYSFSVDLRDVQHALDDAGVSYE